MINDVLDIPFASEWWVILLFAWVYVWKGIALWRAGRAGAKWWFIAILVVNTLGILEILYIYVFSQQKHKSKHHDVVADKAVAETPAEGPASTRPPRGEAAGLGEAGEARQERPAEPEATEEKKDEPGTVA